MIVCGGHYSRPAVLLRPGVPRRDERADAPHAVRPAGLTQAPQNLLCRVRGDLELLHKLVLRRQLIVRLQRAAGDPIYQDFGYLLPLRRVRSPLHTCTLGTHADLRILTISQARAWLTMP